MPFLLEEPRNNVLKHKNTIADTKPLARIGQQAANLSIIFSATAASRKNISPA
jgi:hypothetical protein